MDTRNVIDAVSALVPDELCGGTSGLTDLTSDFHKVMKQEVISNVVHMFKRQLIEKGVEKSQANDKALTLVRDMVDLGDCTLETLARLEHELGCDVAPDGNIKELTNLTSQIIVGLVNINDPESTFSPIESQNLTEYAHAVAECRKKASVIIDMLQGHIEPIVEELLTRYTTLTSQLL